ncbi:MAG: transposase [Methylococcales bacterium]|nr:transposase [Methylococcales bacterium]
MNSSVMGLDIAINIFHMYTMNEKNKLVKKKLKRADVLPFFANYQESLIRIEACGGAHYWARELTKLGHEVIKPLLETEYMAAILISVKVIKN